MTVGELIKELEKYDRELPIEIEAYDENFREILIPHFQVGDTYIGKTGEITGVTLYDAMNERKPF